MVTAIVLAAGVGSRMKSEKAKQFLEVAGHEVLYYSLRAFDEHPEVDSIVLVTKEEFVGNGISLQRFGISVSVEKNAMIPFIRDYLRLEQREKTVLC